MRRTTKTSTTTQTKRRKREEKRWDSWACADLMPHSYPTVRIASEIAIHT
jgi:hypothetical protein